MVDYSDLIARLRAGCLKYTDNIRPGIVRVYIDRTEAIMAQAADTLEALSAREMVLREALEPFAARPTIAERLSPDFTPSEWLGASVERRIEMLGENKRRNDSDILRARTALTNQDGGEKL